MTAANDKAGLPLKIAHGVGTLGSTIHDVGAVAYEQRYGYLADLMETRSSN